MVCSACLLLLLSSVYLICLILVSVLSVSISSTLLVLVSFPLVRSWPVLSSPVQSTWQSSPSRRLVSFGLVFFLSKPPPLPHLLSLSPQNKA